MPGSTSILAVAGCCRNGDPARSSAIRIAILLNSYNSNFLPAIQRSYVRAIERVSPDAQLSFFEPANRDDLPNPSVFDLIVVGGSNVDPRKRHPWILRVHGFVRKVLRDHPRKKLLGLCWGHQTIVQLFGGEVVDMDVPELGVTCINLTENGRKFFPEAGAPGNLRIQQHHRREVSVAPPAMLPLANGNQCFINRENTVLTFQGHPEKDAETAKLRLLDSTRWFGLAPDDEKGLLRITQQIELEHDGDMIWARILEWAKES